MKKNTKSVEEVLVELMNLHPEYKEQLEKAKYAHEFPFSYFQEVEASYRLSDIFEIENDINDYDEIKCEIVRQLDKCEILDYEIIDEIVAYILYDNSIVIKVPEDISKLVGNPLLNISESDVSIVAFCICKLNKCNDLLKYSKFEKELKKENLSYVSLSTLNKMFYDATKM